MTPEQERALRTRARQTYTFRPDAHAPTVADVVLGAMVLPGGVFGETVPLKTRLTIAQEEKHSGKEEQP